MPATTNTFSYAAAAKGSAPTSTPETPPTPASPTQASQTKDTISGTVVQPLVLTAESISTESTPQAMSNGHMETVAATTAPSISVSDTSCTTHNDAPFSSTDSRKDDGASSEISVQRSEKAAPTRRQSAGPRAGDGSTEPRRNNKRGKKNKDTVASEDKDAVPEPAAPKVELSEAPIPSVNPWLQRMAKTKQGVAPSSNPTSPVEGTDPKSSDAPVQPVDSAGETSNPKVEVASQSTGKPSGGNDVNGRKGGGFHDRAAGARTDSRRASPPKPPVDSSSWPTPDTAKDEKRKADKPAERGEKASQPSEAATAAAASSKSKHSEKKNWVKMDFVPTINFETPLPPHKGGARPRGGGRGGRDGSGATRGNSGAGGKNLEKGSGTGGPPAKVNGDTRDGPREGNTGPRGHSLPPALSKRGPMEGSGPREQRKPSTSTAAKPKDSAATVRPKDAASRAGGRANMDKEQNPGQNAGPSMVHQSRDRTDGRGDRSRGGHRNRGGYSGGPTHISTQHPAYQNGYPAQTSMTPRTQQPQQLPVNSPPMRGSSFPTFTPAQHHRGGGAARGGRGVPGGRGHGHGPMGNGTRGGHPPGNMMDHSSVHSHAINYGAAAGSPVASAGPAGNPGIGGVSQYDPSVGALGFQTMCQQIRWYFGIENLCKDMFLRARMDSQGFVPLTLVAGFQRVRSLATFYHEPLGIVRAACLASASAVELVIGDDGIDRIRPRLEPHRWVLPMEDRAELGANDGPSTFTYYSAPANSMHLAHASLAYETHPSMGHAHGPRYTNGQPHMGYTAGMGESFQHDVYANGNGTNHVHHQHHHNGYGQGYANGYNPAGASQLKASVPEFAPRSNLVVNGMNGQGGPMGHSVVNGPGASRESPSAVSGVSAGAKDVKDSPAKADAPMATPPVADAGPEEEGKTDSQAVEEVISRLDAQAPQEGDKVAS